MDKLTISIAEKDNNGYKYKVGKIVINNTPLIEMLKIYEQPYAKNEEHEDLSGAYDSMEVSMLYNHLSNTSAAVYENGKVSILTCECGEEGCWPFVVKIIQDKDIIKWCEFEQPCREEWKYADFGSFMFSAVDYEKEISKLKEALLKDNRGRTNICC